MTKPAAKRAAGLLMPSVLLLLMSYSLIGEAAHEWTGMGLFAFCGYCVNCLPARGQTQHRKES